MGFGRECAAAKAKVRSCTQNVRLVCVDSVRLTRKGEARLTDAPLRHGGINAMSAATAATLLVGGLATVSPTVNSYAFNYSTGSVSSLANNSGVGPVRPRRGQLPQKLASARAPCLGPPRSPQKRAYRQAAMHAAG